MPSAIVFVVAIILCGVGSALVLAGLGLSTMTSVGVGLFVTSAILVVDLWMDSKDS